MFELFVGNDLNQNYIEYINVKKKAKKWGRIFGFLGLFTGIGLILLLLAAGSELNGSLLAMMFILIPMIWIMYIQIGKCYAWGWYWDEKKGHETIFLVIFLGGFIGFLLRIKYHSYGRKMKKQIKNNQREMSNTVHYKENS